MQRQSDGMPSSTQLTIMLKQAVEGGFEQLSNNLMTYFTSLSQKGREIRMAVRVTQNSSVDLFSSVGSTRLNAAIQDWVRQHSKMEQEHWLLAAQKQDELQGHQDTFARRKWR